MDYERESDSSLDAPSSESEAAAQPDEEGTAHTQQADSDEEGLGTDAGLMDDPFASGPTPPEWPPAEFDSTSDEEAAEATALAYEAATEQPVDLGDDSDAPVVAEALAPAAPSQMQPLIRADNVNLQQSGAQTIEAKTVTLSQGGAGQVHADEMSVEQGAVGLARANNLKLGSGASAFAVVADEATVEQGSNAFLVVSRSFNGEVRPTIDWRGALAFGAGVGLVLSIFRRLR